MIRLNKSCQAMPKNGKSEDILPINLLKILVLKLSIFQLKYNKRHVIVESQRQMIMIYAFRTSINTKMSDFEIPRSSCSKLELLTSEFLRNLFENAISTDLWSAGNPC